MKILKTFAGVAGLAALTACSPPGPSVPFAAGQNMEVARAAVDSCAVFAPKGGQNRVTGAYVSTVLFTPIILIVPVAVGTAINEPVIRQRGEASAVDRCLKDSGFARRNLTTEEADALDAADLTTRSALLDHLVAGGQLETFSGT